MGGLRTALVPLLDVLRELSEGSIETLFVRVVVCPLLNCFVSVLCFVVLSLIWLACAVEGLVVGSECATGMGSPVKRTYNLGLVSHFLLKFLFPLLVVG